MRRRAFSLAEILVVLGLFSALSALLWLLLRDVSELWRKTDSKEEATRELVKVRNALTRDLCNASSSQFATTHVGPHLGAGFDGDAITFLSSDGGQSRPEWQLDASGKARLASQVTYYLVVPDPRGDVSAGPADAQGYEQQDPYKWLIRRLDSGGTTLNSAWNGWLVRPGVLDPAAAVISNRLLGFRQIDPPPLLTLEISAVAIKDARHHGPLGAMPLSGGPYTLVQRFSLRLPNP